MPRQRGNSPPVEIRRLAWTRPLARTGNRRRDRQPNLTANAEEHWLAPAAHADAGLHTSRGCKVRLRTIRSAHHNVERRTRWTLAESAEEFTTCSFPVRELVARIQAPRGDHGQHKDPALKEQFFISVPITLADIFRDMGEVEFDGPTATRLQIDEQQSGTPQSAR